MPPTGLYVLTGSNTRSRTGTAKNARYEWYLDRLVRTGLHRKRLHLHGAPNRETAPSRADLGDKRGRHGPRKRLSPCTSWTSFRSASRLSSSYLANPLERERIASDGRCSCGAAGEGRRRAEYAGYVNGVLQEDATPTHVRLHAGERRRIRSHLPGDGHGRKGRTLAPHHARASL